MRLAACVEPQEVLRPAPLSALCRPQDDGEWSGFWALDGERYFARLRRPEGDPSSPDQWFVLVDSSPAVGDGRDPEAPAPQSSARPTPAPRRGAFAARVILRRTTVRPSIDGPAIRRTAAVMVRHRRSDPTR